MINFFHGVQGDQTGLSALRAARSQHRCPMITHAPGHYREVAITALVSCR